MTHAYVLGGSIAGLLSAAALAKHFERVTVLERDETEIVNAPRKGVPQGKSPHALLRAGADAVDKLLPGLFQDLVKNGGIEIDAAEETEWFHHGTWKQRHKSGLTAFLASRPLFEKIVYEHVSRLPNVEIR